jgi:hypothetical protein
MILSDWCSGRAELRVMKAFARAPRIRPCRAPAPHPVQRSRPGSGFRKCRFDQVPADMSRHYV